MTTPMAATATATAMRIGTAIPYNQRIRLLVFVSILLATIATNTSLWIGVRTSCNISISADKLTLVESQPIMTVHAGPDCGRACGSDQPSAASRGDHDPSTQSPAGTPLSPPPLTMDTAIAAPESGGLRDHRLHVRQQQKGNGENGTATVPHLQPDRLRHDPHNSLSACLLWMDDYNRLVEWIAYHYYTMSLRTLVIRRDPSSMQDLTPLLQRWKDLMNITVWHGVEDFVCDKHRSKIPMLKVNAERESASGTSRRHQSALRLFAQTEFYRGCARHLKRHNRTWTLLTDTDEFITLNSRHVSNATSLMTRPGAVFRALQYVQMHNVTRGVDLHEQPCITLGRYQYGSIESPDEHVRRNVPSFIDPYRFQTLRFRHPEATLYIGKTIADVSRLDITDHSNITAHSFIKGQCPKPWGSDHDVLRISHYVGSHEMFVRQNDRRKWENRTEKWVREGTKSLGKAGPPIGDEARGWIGSFVNHFGKEASEYLLNDAGFAFNAATAMKRLSPKCGMDCVEVYRPETSLFSKIDEARQVREAASTDPASDLHSISLSEFVEAGVP